MSSTNTTFVDFLKRRVPANAQVVTLTSMLSLTFRKKLVNDYYVNVKWNLTIGDRRYSCSLVQLRVAVL